MKRGQEESDLELNLGLLLFDGLRYRFGQQHPLENFDEYLQRLQESYEVFFGNPKGGIKRVFDLLKSNASWVESYEEALEVLEQELAFSSATEEPTPLPSPAKIIKLDSRRRPETNQ